MLGFILLTLVVWILIWLWEVKNGEAELPWTKPRILDSVHRRWKKQSQEKYAPYGVAKPWKLPYYASAISNPSSKVLKKSNKYLVHMQRKLIYSLHNPTKDGPDSIVDILLSRSKTFLVYGLKESDPHYFWNKTTRELFDNLAEVRMKMRTKSIDLSVKRFYLPKEVRLEDNGEIVKFRELEEMYNTIELDDSGGYIPDRGCGFKTTKWRPIGAPDTSSKIILNMMTHIVNEFNFIHLRDYQHGFRPGLGVVSACLSLRKAIIKRRMRSELQQIPFYVHEFDLKGFFNQVNPYFTLRELARGGLKAFANWIELMNSYMVPDYSKSGIKEETELKWVQEAGLRKSGFTQGSPLSPPLSMLGFDKSGVPDLISGDLTDDLVMYADDGVLICDKMMTHDDFEYLFNFAARNSSGVLLARDKYFGEVRNGRFRFLGLDWDLNDYTVTCDGATYFLQGQVAEEDWNKIFSKAKYKGGKSEWHWSVKRYSLLDNLWPTWYGPGGMGIMISLANRLGAWTGYLIEFTGYIERIWDPNWNKAWRYYAFYKKGIISRWGIFNTNTASSLAAESVLRILHKMEDRTGIIRLGVDSVQTLRWYDRHLIDRRRILHKIGAVEDYGVKGCMYYYHKDFAGLDQLKSRKSIWAYQWLHPSESWYF